MKNCLQCGKEFEAVNPKAVYCSGACKVKYSRLHSKDKTLDESESDPVKEISLNTPLRTGELCNVEFSNFLRGFNTFFEKGQMKNITDLRDRARYTNIMTPRQKEAILARCDEAINGTYGETKRPEHLIQNHKQPVK